jgi:hypothetical protein
MVYFIFASWGSALAMLLSWRTTAYWRMVIVYLWWITFEIFSYQLNRIQLVLNNILSLVIKTEHPMVFFFEIIVLGLNFVSDAPLALWGLYFILILSLICYTKIKNLVLNLGGPLVEVKVPSAVWPYLFLVAHWMNLLVHWSWPIMAGAWCSWNVGKIISLIILEISLNIVLFWWKRGSFDNRVSISGWQKFTTLEIWRIWWPWLILWINCL